MVPWERSEVQMIANAHKPGKNGHAHERNGHPPAACPAGSPPLDAVSTVDLPGAATRPPGDGKPSAEGRTAKGTFAPGNTVARGNPNARRMAALRSALLECLTGERMKALGERLYAAAVGGDWTAAKLLLAYAVGKPREAVDADRLDLDEWKLLDAAPTLAQYLRLSMDGVDPKDAAELFKKLHPQGEAEFTRTLAAALKEMQEGRGSGQRMLSEERNARIGK
jgi:hypothetical protein